VTVTAPHRGGTPVGHLNELETVDARLWANVWYSSAILVIDPASGLVACEIDASALVADNERRRGGRGDPRNDVLNGIAYEPTTRTLLVTGKRWDSIYEFRLEGGRGGCPGPLRLGP
jgi:glutamine cyclotransferase